jgi:hypothetical protein
MKPFTADQLTDLQSAQPDEFGVTQHEILLLELSILQLASM